MTYTPPKTGWSGAKPKAVDAPPEKTILDRGPIRTWSASAWDQFSKCQHALFLRRVKKVAVEVTEESHKARNRGIKVHDEAEKYVRGERERLPSSLKKFKSRFVNLREAFSQGRVLCEEDWIFDPDWCPAEKFSEEAWLWAKLDAIEFDDRERKGATIIDYKTGKKDAAKHGMQGLLYACAAFMRYPSLQYVRVEFWYVDKGEDLLKTYSTNDLPIFLPRVNERGVKITTEKEFAPSPSANNCRYCDYRENGCDYAIVEDAPMERYRAPRAKTSS